MRKTLGWLVVLVVTIAACTANVPASTPDADLPAASPADPAVPGVDAARPSASPPTVSPTLADTRDLGIARLGALTDPLPRPLPLPTGSGDVPAALAKRVMAGGGDALPALVGALQASGVAVNGTGPGFVVKPAEPWQGVVVESWEVRMLLATVLPERTVTQTMTELAAPLRASAALKDVPLEKLIVEDLRRAAASPNATPKRFWARFVIELGRDPRSADPDLANAVDPASVRVNGLQASLILRRLAVDLLMLRARATASGGPGYASLGAAPPLEQRPCTMNDTGRTAGDLVAIGAALGVGGIDDFGFSGLTGFLESTFGGAAAEAFKLFGGIGNALLTYVTLFLTYAALEVKVEMDSAPLTRTKQVRPSSGERKQLTAVVRMNTGDAQILNCFRVMLNAVGLDLKLPQDGAVKGAQLGWQGDAGFSLLVESRGGPDQIVQFADAGGGGTSFNSITKSVTDDDGKARVTVEGVGQRVRKSENAAKVIRHARVHVNVALTGADLFGDLSGAVGAGIGGVQALISLPAEMLYRSQWASAGFHTFEVVDWGGTQWSGTLTIKRTEVTKGEANGRTTDVQTVSEAKVNVIEATKYESVGDTTIAEMRGTIDGRYTKLGTVSLKWTQVSDSRICVGKTWSGTDFEQDSEEGSGTADAEITVRASGLEYEILAVPAAGAEDMPVKGQVLLQGHRFRQAGDGCANVVVDTTSETRSVSRTEPMLTIEVKAQADPDQLDHLTGSKTTTEHVGGKEITTTITWDLRSD